MLSVKARDKSLLMSGNSFQHNINCQTAAGILHIKFCCSMDLTYAINITI